MAGRPREWVSLLNLIDLLRGVLTGYVVRFLQVLASLLVVPFLLRDDVLGIETYGRIFSILASLGLVNMLTDGLRVSYSRSIAQALDSPDERVAECVGSGIKAMMLLVASVGIILVWIRPAILGFLEIPVTRDWMTAIALAIAQTLIGNLLYIFQSYALARGRLDFVNQVSMVEVIARNAAIIGIFMFFEASATGYMAILTIGVLGRYLSFAVYGFLNHPEDFRGMFGARIENSLTVIRYSFAISAASFQYFVLYRLSIPLVNRWIGSEEAGLLAIALNTIASNASQVLFSVVRPILVPLTARLDFRGLSPERRRILHELDALYSIFVIIFMAPLISAMPLLISLWLGTSYSQLVVPAQVLVAGSAIQVGFNIRRAMLVGQGYAASIARISMILVPISALGLVSAAVWLSHWHAVAFVGAGFTALNAILAHGLVYERRFMALGDARGDLFRVVVSMLLCLVIAGSLSLWVGDSIRVALIVGLLTLVVVIAVSHFLILPIPRAMFLFKRLRRSAHTPLFSADTADIDRSDEVSR